MLVGGRVAGFPSRTRIHDQPCLPDLAAGPQGLGEHEEDSHDLGWPGRRTGAAEYGGSSKGSGWACAGAFISRLGVREQVREVEGKG